MTQRHLLSLLLALAVGAQPALAQLADPTRPAAALMTQDAAGAVGAPGESGVQAVILRRAGKSAAVINGQYVEVGGRLGDKQVQRISESEVVLIGEAGREVIKVTPAIEKIPARKQAPAAKRRTTGTTEK